MDFLISQILLLSLLNRIGIFLHTAEKYLRVIIICYNYYANIFIIYIALNKWRCLQG